MRLDVYVCSNNDGITRSRAQKLIEASRIKVDGQVVTKASYEVDEKSLVEIIPASETEYVGRGGYKLEHALKHFDVTAENKVALDIGASTGGFTQCLLLNGAAVVYAVDSGNGQLARELKSDSRVVSLEGFNARNLTLNELHNKRAELVVMDVSFISQKLLYPAILRTAAQGADVITLIKPQFEVGRQNIGKKGIVKDEKAKRKCIEDIIEYAKASGFEYVSHTKSPITGGDGNEEFLLHLRVK